MIRKYSGNLQADNMSEKIPRVWNAITGIRMCFLRMYFGYVKTRFIFLLCLIGSYGSVWLKFDKAMAQENDRHP